MMIRLDRCCSLQDPDLHIASYRIVYFVAHFVQGLQMCTEEVSNNGSRPVADSPSSIIRTRYDKIMISRQRPLVDCGNCQEYRTPLRALLSCLQSTSRVDLAFMSRDVPFTFVEIG